LVDRGDSLLSAADLRPLGIWRRRLRTLVTDSRRLPLLVVGHRGDFRSPPCRGASSSPSRRRGASPRCVAEVRRRGARRLLTPRWLPRWLLLIGGRFAAARELSSPIQDSRHRFAATFSSRHATSATVTVARHSLCCVLN